MKEDGPVNMIGKVDSVFNRLFDERKETCGKILNILDRRRPFTDDEREEFISECPGMGELTGLMKTWNEINDHKKISKEMVEHFEDSALSYFFGGPY